MNLYLIRGLPGSGKTTVAKDFAQNICAYHYEADMYFIDEETGEYKFDVSRLDRAHQWCLSMTAGAMQLDFDVVVSNTLTTEKELKPYLDLAEYYGYRVTTLIVEGRHGNKSVHDVPDETITKMRNRFSVKL